MKTEVEIRLIIDSDENTYQDIMTGVESAISQVMGVEDIYMGVGCEVEND